MSVTSPTDRIENEWRIKLSRRSYPDQRRWKELHHFLKSSSGTTCLDIGGDSGVLSQQLRTIGGVWHSADISAESVEATKKMVGERVYQIKDGKFPFEDGKFDIVVLVNRLEYFKDAQPLIAECNRVLRSDGYFIVQASQTKSGSIIRLLKRLLGLRGQDPTMQHSGYTESQIFDMLKDGFDVQEVRTYSRFFVELVDTLVQWIASSPLGTKDRTGREISKERLYERAFRIYTVAYPIFWIAGQLDLLLFFTKGFHLIASGRRRTWRPRRIPTLIDGRSIADAAINTKIGTAAPF
ncbi:MAG: class I SAM-dependent methyltransferase [Verrucomicrobia bacterium]|nr:class I SAM-dependent methyltransferase [Verrucomicrobiota bacterium]